MLLLHQLKVYAKRNRYCMRGSSMYEPMLDTFLAVADCGSFTKAAEQLFISPTAIMKQMNSLENSEL